MAFAADYEEKSYFMVRVLGNKNVGKTNLIFRMVQKDAQLPRIKFDLYDDPDFGARTFVGNDKAIQLRLSQGLGYREANASGHAVIFVFDLTDRVSFDDVLGWITQFRRMNDEALIFIVGTKADEKEKRVIPEEDITDLCNKCINAGENVKYFEVSARTNKNIKELCETVSRDIFLKINPVRKLEPKAMALHLDVQSALKSLTSDLKKLDEFIKTQEKSSNPKQNEIAILKKLSAFGQKFVSSIDNRNFQETQKLILEYNSPDKSGPRFANIHLPGGTGLGKIFSSSKSVAKSVIDAVTALNTQFDFHIAPTLSIKQSPVAKLT